ncbi:MAG: glucose-1-phosphate thymidylyltransferase [Candidatus Coatesbacteria bacterium]|nr:MAG: glucose-1-phosphate thymidylyltransferase [Candidatus Coatesbacteria bacterium]
MPEELKPAAFFDLATTAYGEFLSRFEWPWDPLREIGALARELLRGLRGGEIMPGAHVLGDDVDIGPGTVVEPGAVIKGPTVIGANCEIRAGAYIRGEVVVADGCVVGNSTEVKNSLMLEGSHAPHFNYVGDSILGQRANLGAGVKLSNWKVAADKNVKLAVAGVFVDTGLDKFGAVLGDDVEIGCNTVTNPGTVVGPRTIIYANSNVRGLIPADSVVKLRQPQQIVPRRRG